MVVEWKTVPIRDVYSGMYDGPHATPKPSDSGPIFLGIKNVAESGHLDLSDVRHISEEEFPRWTKRVEPRGGDIVFSYEATLNRYAVIPRGFRGCLGRRMALIRPDESKACGRFLHFYFFGPEWRKVIARNTLVGSTVDRIPIAKFPDFPVTLPPLVTQRKIAAILSAYDDLIENNLRRIKILEAMAQNLYREWFVKFRFPGHQHARFVDSPLGPIPEGWEVKMAPEAVEIRPNVPVPRVQEIAFIPMSSLSENSMLIGEIETRSKASGARFQNGDTLFARITPCLENGKTGFVQFLPDDKSVGCGSTEFIVLRSRTLCPEYVYLMARSDDFRDNAIKSMSGASGRQRVQDRCFERFLLAQPSRDILETFRGITEPTFRLLHQLNRKSAILRQTRDLLLPKLISGELDVSELDITIPEGLAETQASSEDKVTRIRETSPKPSTATLPKAAEAPEAYGDAAPEAPVPPTPIEEWDTNDVMAIFRQVARTTGQTDRDTLLKAVSEELGYARLGSKIKTVLKGHLKAAIRRHIIGTDGGQTVWPETRTMDSFDRDELVETFRSVMRKGTRYEREDIYRAVANHLGFRRLTDTVREPIKSAINGGIRRGVLGYEGNELWREE